MNTRPPVLFTTMALLLLGGCASDNPHKNAHRAQYGLRQDVGIDSYPRGARVYIDGEMVGTTPLSAELRSNKTYEVVFERAGYKPYVEYVGPDLDLKMDPFIKIGPLENRGMYNRLGPNPLQVEMEHELVPDIAGTNLLAEMLLKTDQLDKHLNEGMIPIEEHRYVTQQLMDYYDDESYRRTGAPLRKDRQRASIADELANPSAPVTPSTADASPPSNLPSLGIPPLDSEPTATSTPATSAPPVNIPGELPDLNFIQLDAAPAGTPPAQPPAAMPDLNNINLGTSPPVAAPAQPLPGNVPPPPTFTPPPGSVPQPQPAPAGTPGTPAPSGDPLLDGIF